MVVGRVNGTRGPMTSVGRQNRPFDVESGATSSSRAPGPGFFHVYVLELTGERYYVGAASDVREAFAEHLAGSGARVTTRWKPVGFGPLCISPPIARAAGGNDYKDALRTDVEELERLVTAQLVILLGVNKVRGGGVKDVHTGDGSIVIDYDLVHARDYTRTNADLDLVASKVSSPLGLDFIATRKHIDNMLRDHSSGQAYFGTPRIHIDPGWNVVVNGGFVAHKALHTIPYDPIRAIPHPRIEQNEWGVLFSDGPPRMDAVDEEDMEYPTDDADFPTGHDAQDVFVIAFGVLLVSIITLAICTFSNYISIYVSSSQVTLPIVLAAFILPTGVTMQMRQRAGPFNMLFVVIFTVTTSIMASYLAAHISPYAPFMLFMWTMGLMAAGGVMAVVCFLWGKATGGRNGLLISSIFGIVADISVLVAMFMTWSGVLAGGTPLGTGGKVGFGFGYIIITGICLGVLLVQAWKIDVRERYITKRAAFCVPSSAIPALICYGIGYALFAMLTAVKFV